MPLIDLHYAELSLTRPSVFILNYSIFSNYGRPRVSKGSLQYIQRGMSTRDLLCGYSQRNCLQSL